jgi:DNA-binding NtrC family response regulator
VHQSRKTAEERSPDGRQHAEPDGRRETPARKRVYFAWIGNTDLAGPESDNPGPIAAALRSGAFDAAELLYTGSETPDRAERMEAYRAWLQVTTSADVAVHGFPIDDPTHTPSIHAAAQTVVEEAKARHGADAERAFHLNSGTSEMMIVWTILGHTQYRARLLMTHRETGLAELRLPFHLSAEFVPPDALDDHDRILEQRFPRVREFDAPAIVHACEAMRRVVRLAHRCAVSDKPILLQGETGTGKEVFARAIHLQHAAARRSHPSRGRAAKDSPFVARNCGGFAEQLITSELFGHVRGAFTGADRDRKGAFELAHGGTLFLDEIAELPLHCQATLLRVLEDGEIVRVGDETARRVEVRVIAATNRDLDEEVRAGRFRADLAQRIGVLRIAIPPLRERGGDIDLIATHFVERANADLRAMGLPTSTLGDDARQRLREHSWPQNVRQLANVLTRAVLCARSGTIDAATIDAALAPSARDDLLHRPLPVDLEALHLDLDRHYLSRALQESGNSNRAFRRVGFGNLPTFRNRCRKAQIPLDKRPPRGPAA